MQRHAFGILALMFFAASAYLYLGLWPPYDVEPFYYSILQRVGIVLAALWLAYPELLRIPPWMYGMLAVAASVVMIQPRLIIIVAPMVVFIWLLCSKK